MNRASSTGRVILAVPHGASRAVQAGDAVVRTVAPGRHGALYSRDFPGSAAQVRAVRRWIEALLPDCGPRYDVLLLASELSANAVEHTRSGQPGGQFGVHLEWSRELARVVVDDLGSAEEPAFGTGGAGPAAESGRGLFMVEEMADGWGTACFPGGRCTWFDVRWAARGGPAPLPGSRGTGLAVVTGP